MESSADARVMTAVARKRRRPWLMSSDIVSLLLLQRVSHSLLALHARLLRRGPDDDLVDFHLGRLLDGVSDRLRERGGRNRHCVELAQILSWRFLRAASLTPRLRRGPLGRVLDH